MVADHVHKNREALLHGLRIVLEKEVPEVPPHKRVQAAEYERFVVETADEKRRAHRVETLPIDEVRIAENPRLENATELRVARGR